MKSRLCDWNFVLCRRTDVRRNSRSFQRSPVAIRQKQLNQNWMSDLASEGSRALKRRPEAPEIAESVAGKMRANHFKEFGGLALSYELIDEGSCIGRGRPEIRQQDDWRFREL